MAELEAEQDRKLAEMRRRGLIPSTSSRAEAIEKAVTNYKNRPRKKFVSADKAGEHQHYVDACIEKIFAAWDEGTELLNDVPEKVSVIVTFTVSSSGDLAEIAIDSASNFAEFDSSIQSAIKRAAPFPAFPEDSRRTVDQLVVTAAFTKEKVQSDDAQPKP